MELLIACSCGLDPATETMAVQMGAAVVIAAPFWFRERIAQAVRKVLSKPNDEPADCEGDDPSG